MEDLPLNRIVAGILSLQQHWETLALDPDRYRPECCPHCGFGSPWHHGHYERKTDRSPKGPENPVWIPRFYCRHCRHTCSRLPSCVAPRRWYGWAIQQCVLMYLWLNFSLSFTSLRFGPSRDTCRRWLRWLQDRHLLWQFRLCTDHPDWGRTPEWPQFWSRVLGEQALSELVAWLDGHGVSVP
jgi:hypothetical protein